ncbi:MAG: carboxylating nicotinate-nucleotide diphosphorylase [Acidiferrobacterales bacterium]|nr:carboxylating nicotinate-nucleotide diphosphorylase [Acidiferrobacterales bacterium]
MKPANAIELPGDIPDIVRVALREDVGDGDATSCLIEDREHVNAYVKVRESAILCGCAWFNEVFHQTDPSIQIDWLCDDADELHANQTVCRLNGSARSLLTAERTALNFLQTLSGTATVTNQFVQAIAEYRTRILDTRKTVPGLRNAQKYAVRIGGGTNHRHGLYDGILIKDNHQYATHSLESILRGLPDSRPALIEVEIERLDQLEGALRCGANRIMLDNFSVDNIAQAVKINAHRVELEASGNIDLGNIREVARTGVDYISVGAITKNVRAIDFTMLFDSSGANA